ncbi:MAG: HEAT repeat domain-containing protein [Phycisphaerales bacterium]|nr:MAG: HEAT repeat domain-containing protein [Phycisphaerales bacterium]
MSERLRFPWRILWPVLVTGCLGVVGCAGNRRAAVRQLESPDPSERILAIIELAERDDDGVSGGGPVGRGSVVPLLVDRLEDEDEGVRFFAIVALEKLTGTRRGYRYSDPDHLRREAVQRWRASVAVSSPGAVGGDEGVDW